jgi:hypothetical protein
MQRLSRRGNQVPERLMRRLDRVADEVNPFLIILMLGLIILIAIRLTTMGLANLPIIRVDPSCLTSPASTNSGGEAVNRPS